MNFETKRCKKIWHAEVKLIRHIAGYSLSDHRRYDILEERKVDLVEKKLAQYKEE
jgi:phage terminase Nu1 subunit (DNA packaging protein)